QDYLTKPFSAEELRVRLNNQITIKRACEVLQQELSSQSRELEELAAEIRSRMRELEASLEEARHSRELYVTLARNFSHDAVLLFDRDLRFLVAESAGLAGLGFSSEALEGRTIWEVLPAATSKILESHFRAALAGTSTTFEMPYGHSTYLVHAMPVKNERGDTYAAMAVVQDISERRHDEWNRFQATILENISDAVNAIDNKHRIIYWNHAAEELYGLTSDEVLGHELEDVYEYVWLKPEDFTAARGALDNNGSWQGECIHRIKHSGAEIHAEISISRLRDRTGAPAGYLAVIRDVTARRRAEAQLQRSNQTLGTLFRASPMAIVTLDRDLNVTMWNPRAERIFGWRERDVLGQPLPKIPGDRDEAFRAACRLALSGSAFTTFETRCQRSDVSMMDISISTAPLRTAEGEISGVMAVVADITERKRTETERAQLLAREHAAREEAEAAQRHLALLAEASSVLVSSLDYEVTLANVAHLAVPDLAEWCIVDLVDSDGAIQRVAAAHADPANEALMSELRRYPPDLDKALSVSRVLRTGQPDVVPAFSDEQLQEIAVDAEHFNLLRQLRLRSHMCVPLLTRGRILGALTFSTSQPNRRYGPDDLSLAQELARRAAVAVDNARLYRELQESSRAKDEFLSILSHELRTPLTSIYGWTCMLKEDDLDEEIRTEALETIEHCANMQMQIIGDLLDVSRLITGKLRLHVRTVEIAPVVAAALDAIRPAAEAKSLQLETELEAVGPVAADPSRIQQIIWNLVSNAVKFTPQGGSVEVRLDRDVAKEGEYARIRVSDTGQGIETEFLPHVFDRFRQADSANTRAHGGLGMGLALVRDLIEMHGGTIRVTSAGKGQGTTFTVRLPLATVAETTEGKALAEGTGVTPATPTTVTKLSSSTLSGLRVLIVDDDADARKLFTVVLTRHGAAVQSAGSVAEALGIFERWQPDVVAADIGLPDEDGYALIRKIRAHETQRGGRTPAIAVTGYVTPEDRTSVLRAGYQVHLAKPVELDELVATVSSLAALTAKG
ncbi:MAG: PAS domain S-box protein, partial [Armatimonadota bacterium]|nr:PAS domain S-box protein [Armatimonadota bacterium]